MPAARSSDGITLEQALEVCVRGFATNRSLTHPCVVEPYHMAGGVAWLAHDAPRRRGPYRREEWFTLGLAPVEADALAPGREQGGRWSLCVLVPRGEAEEPWRAGFRALDYRLLGAEPLMVRPLTRVPRAAVAVSVERVLDEALAARLARAARARQVLPEHLVEDAPVRQYVAWVDGEIAGWVKSIEAGDATYCSDMLVREPYRRRGVATAMLHRLLRDDRAHGARAATLLASQMGALLYPTVGYRTVGTLLILQPRR